MVPFSKSSRRTRAVAALLLAGTGVVVLLPALSSLSLDRARAQTPADPNALLRNGDFSAGQGQPDGWTLQIARGTGAETARDTQGARSAPAALRFEVHHGASASALTNGRAAVSQPLLRVPNDELTLSGWSKTRGLTGTARALVRTFDENGEELDVEAIDLPSSTDWQAFSCTLTLPQGAARAECAFEFVGRGTLWLDDISLAPAAPPA